MESFRIWTDGCCLKPPWGKTGPGGWAMVVEEDGEVIDTDCAGYDETTSLRMEMLAIIAGFRYTKGRRVEVYCDAQFLVNGAIHHLAKWKHRGWRRRSRKSASLPLAEVDLWEEIDELLCGSLATISWVPSHAGYPFNEYADELADVAARGARSASWGTPPPSIAIPALAR
jgi:ribonuclease HI